MIRSAQLGDLDALVALEVHAFETDRLTRRSLRHLLTRAKAATLVYEDEGRLLGYVTLLFKRGTSLAHLYSIAVSSEARGRGVGKALVEAAECESRVRDCAYVRLEVRVDNTASLALFRGMGYRQFGRYDDYYEDHADALRFQKPLVPLPAPTIARVPYFEQTLDFTCGPAALMMAMKALDPTLVLDRKLELRLWREATTIFMLSGHGGCGPYGLALAAAARGFRVSVHLSGEDGVFLGRSVRDPEKREVMRLVQEDMEEELRSMGIPVSVPVLRVTELAQRLATGALPLVLVSSYRLYGDRLPHWVVVTGVDRHFVYIHDPFVDRARGGARVASIDLPIDRRSFDRMARYGRAGHGAALVLERGPAHTSETT